MGAPELPTDPGEDILQSHFDQQAPVPSDESDESTSAYDGYEPLTMANNIEDSDDNLSDNTILNTDPNVCNTVSVDVEVVCQVSNEPRHQELQIELDRSLTEQILSVMANISLPNIAIPEWARDVPEESWKDELLARIRQQNITKSVGKSSF